MRLFSTPRRMEDLALFTRHVAGAMAARAPLPDLLRAYMRDSEDSQLAKAVDVIADRTESGVALSEALEDYPHIFPTSYRRLVRLGEEGRTLGGVMEQLADNLERGLKTFEYFRRAAIYPLLVSILLFLDVCFVSITLVPKMEEIYRLLGGDLGGIFSGPTLHTASQTIFLGFGLVILIPIIFLIGAVMGLRMNGFSYGKFQLQLPLIGPVLRRAETARFASNLALLLENKIPLAESLGLLADSTDNSYARKAITDFQVRFQQGEPLGDLIASQPLFPASMAAMVASGEDQGGLAETLRGLGRFYSERTAHGLTVLREMLEPLLLLLLGLLVALIMLSMYMPLFSIPRLIW